MNIDTEAERTGLRVMAIGGDAGLWLGKNNGTYRRQMAYAARLEHYVFLCYTPPGFEMLRVAPNFIGCPTNSKHRALFFRDGFCLGLRMIRRWKPQVIVSQDAFGFGLLGLMLKLVARLPLVVHYHSGFQTNPYWFKQEKRHRFLACIARLVTLQADVIRTVSSDIQRDLVTAGYNRQRIFYATPPVAAEPFETENPKAEEEIRERYNLNRNKTFLFIGRLSREKNIPMMIRAVGNLPPRHKDLKLLIIGQGPEEAGLKRLVRRLHLDEQVIFVGGVNHSQLKDYIRCAAALIISSHYEGTAKVIKEAALSERPCITTHTSGVSDAVQHGRTGVVIPIGDEDALREALCFCMEKPALCREMGQRAKHFVSEKFDYHKDVDGLIDVWRSALKRRTSFGRAIC